MRIPRGIARTGLTVLAALTLGLVVLILVSDRPSRAVTFFFAGPFLNLYSFGNMLGSAVPLMLTGMGIVAAFRASVFNLGGEGQVYTGALIATMICLALPRLPGWAGILLSLAAGTLVGAVLAGLSGLFYARWRTNELLSSFLLSAAAVLIVDYLIAGPLDDPASNLLATPAVASRFRLLRILPPSYLDAGVAAVLLLAVLLTVYLFKTRSGYELRMCGSNREFAQYGGIRVGLYLVLPMVMSGGFHGLAGGMSILCTHYRCIQGFSVGLGWNGIAVALIGRNHPLGVIPAALLYAYLEAGAQAAVLHAGMSFEIATLVQAVIFYLVTAQGLISWIPREGLLKHRGRPPLRGRRKR